MPHYRDFIKHIVHGATKANDSYDNFMAGVGAGIGRSVVGTAQGLSGLEDLVTPGTGTNRVSKLLDRGAKGIDNTIRDQGGNQVGYKIGQIGGDIGQLFVGGTEVKGVSKGSEFLSKLAGASTKVDEAANAAKAAEDTSKTSNVISKVTDQLDKGNAAQRATSASIKGITDPKTQAGIGVYTALSTGANASKGRDTDPKEVIKNLVENELFTAATPAVGSLIRSGASATKDAVVNAVTKGPAVKAAEDATGLTHGSIVDNHDAAHLNDFAHSDTAAPDDTIRTVAEKAGLDPEDKAGIKDYLGKRNQFIQTHAAVAQGGYVGPGGRDAAIEKNTTPAEGTADVPPDPNAPLTADDHAAARQQANQAINTADVQTSATPPTDPNAPATLPARPDAAGPTAAPADAPTSATPPQDPNAPATLPTPPAADATAAAPQPQVQTPQAPADLAPDAPPQLPPAPPGVVANHPQAVEAVGAVTDGAAGVPRATEPGPPAPAPEQAPPPGTGGPETPVGPTPAAPKGNTYGDATDELLGRFQYGKDAKDALAKEKGTGVREQLKEQFYDRFSPVNSFVKQIEEATGHDYHSDATDPYSLMRLSQGLPDAVNQKIQGIASVLAQAPDLNSVKAIGMARQILSRSERGLTSTITPERARQVIDEQRTRLGDEGFHKAAEVVDAVGKYNKGMIEDLHTEGIIGDAAKAALDEMGGDYFAKMNVLSKVLEKDQNRALFSATGSFNTTKQSIKKVLAEAQGHAEGEKILDPIESLVLGTNNSMRLIQKNQVYKAFQKLSTDAPDLVQPIRTADSVLEKISLSTENKEMRPIRNALVRTIKSNKNTLRKLSTQVNQLERSGLKLSLSKGGERMTNQEFDVGGLGGEVPTSQAGKGGIRETANFKMTDAERGLTEAVGVKNNPNQLGPRDTADFLRNLIQNGSQKDIDRIRGKIDTRETKLHAVLDKLSDIKSQYDEIATRVKANSDRTKELADAALPDGYALITGYDKGVETKLAVPKAIADVFTGKTPGQQDYLTSIVNKVNGFVKQNFTSNNPTFALLTNPIRDSKNFALNAKDVGASPWKIGGALAKGFLARALPGKINPYTDLVDRWVAAGGKSGFYSDERSGEKLAKDIQLQIAGKRSPLSLGVKVNEVNSAKDFMREAGRVISAPLRVARDRLHGAASVLEDAPRVAQFMASVKADKSDAVAALNARNVTVDFNQAGRIGQTVNAWVPFLNARGQGTIKSIQAIKNNPARAAAVYATLTAAPLALMAYNNEHRFKDVMKMIPDQDRDNNFIIVLNDHKDANGKFTGVIKIPKSDVDKTLGNPLEMVFRKMAGDNPDNLQAIITNAIGSMLPVDTVKDDKFNTSRAVGGILPPFIKAPIENATNHNLYYDSNLVPTSKQALPDRDQINPNTSTAAKFVGAVTGASPIKVDNTIRNFSGNLITEAPQDQLGGNLVGANASRMNTEFYKVYNGATKERAEISQQINQAISEGDTDTAQRLATQYNSYLAQQFTPFVKTYRDQLTQQISDEYDKLPLVLTRRSISQRQRNILERQAAQ